MNHIGDIVFLIYIALLILGVISFVLFIRKLLVHSQSKKNHSQDIELKLDRIIDLLEKE
jgi:hypothetical protein